MRNTKPFERKVVLTVFAFTLTTAVLAAAQTESVLHSFSNLGLNIKGGMEPLASLTTDTAGNLYGTAPLGGSNCDSYNGCGTVFQLVPKAGGGWTENVLHNFNDTGGDGYTPTAGVILDSAGNIYGTTEDGGTYGGQGYGAGIVYELSPKKGGKYAESVIHSFDPDAGDGYAPSGSLLLDSKGNLYGTTAAGGTYGIGTVFTLSPKAGGGFTEVILYSFGSNQEDGDEPEGGLVFDRAGNLYGTTYQGGAYNFGTVYKLTPTGTGQWTESVIYSFPNSADAYPESSLAIDSAGNLYGTAIGGNASYGTVFKLTLSGGVWAEQVLHQFCTESGCADGSEPEGTPILDSAGNLYGVTRSDGSGNGGTVFQMTPSGASWTLTTLHNFGLTKNDGTEPWSGVILDKSGHLYGTTFAGGSAGVGTVYEVKP